MSLTKVWCASAPEIRVRDVSVCVCEGACQHIPDMRLPRQNGCEHDAPSTGELHPRRLPRGAGCWHICKCDHGWLNWRCITALPWYSPTVMSWLSTHTQSCIVPVMHVEQSLVISFAYSICHVLQGPSAALSSFSFLVRAVRSPVMCPPALFSPVHLSLSLCLRGLLYMACVVLHCMQVKPW